METTEFKEITQKFHEIMKENDRFRDLKERYVEHAKKLIALSQSAIELSEQMNDLAKEIDPVVALQHNGRKSNADYETTFEELLNVMKGGDQITSDKIRKMYPNFDFHNVAYIFKQLRTMKNIGERKEGKNLYFFLKNGGD